MSATHRLRRLLELYGDDWGVVREYSGNLPQRDRTAILQEFRRKTIVSPPFRRYFTGCFHVISHLSIMMVNIMALQSVIVCSDSMARGLDIDSVSNVVNYDVPVFAKTYVHRVGRTARAGREGSSYTLCKYISFTYTTCGIATRLTHCIVMLC